MKTTILVDDEPINDTKQLTGISKTSQVITEALIYLKDIKTRERLGALYGSMKENAPNVSPFNFAKVFLGCL